MAFWRSANYLPFTQLFLFFNIHWSIASSTVAEMLSLFGFILEKVGSKTYQKFPKW